MIAIVDKNFYGRIHKNGQRDRSSDHIPHLIVGDFDLIHVHEERQETGDRFDRGLIENVVFERDPPPATRRLQRHKFIHARRCSLKPQAKVIK